MTASSDLVAELHEYGLETPCCYEAADRILALEADKAALVEALEIISKHGYGAAFDWSPQGSERWDGIVTHARATLAKHGGE